MIKVLHFASIINRFDIIDTVLSRFNTNKINVLTLTAIPSRREEIDSLNNAYDKVCLNIPFKRANYFYILFCLIKRVWIFRPDIIVSHHYEESILTYIALLFTPKTKWIIGRHYNDQIYLLSNGFRLKVHIFLESLCNEKANKIFVPSVEIYNLLTIKQRVNKEKVEIIPFVIDTLGGIKVDLVKSEYLRKIYNSQEKFILITCGRLNPEKGLDYFIKALPKITQNNENLIVYIIGDGPLKENLSTLIKNLHLENHVKLIGWSNDIYEWMHIADCLVQPSLSESFCQVLIESYLIKTPVIMTPVGAAPLIIGNDNSRGIIIEIANVDSIVRAIQFMINNKSEMPLMGERGYHFVKAHLNPKKSAEIHEDLYKRVINVAL